MLINHIGYHFGTISHLMFLTVAVGIFTIFTLWKHRTSPGIKYLIYLEIAACIFAFTYGMEFGTPLLEAKIWWSKLSYFGIAFLPVFYLLFTTAFSQNKQRIPPLRIVLLSVIPVLTILLVLTNESHRLVWTDVVAAPQKNMVFYNHGFWFWIYWFYSLILLMGGLTNLIVSSSRPSSYYRSQIIFLLLGSFFPIFGNIIYVMRLNPIPGFDWTPLSFVFTGLVISFGVIRFKIFDLIPIARNKLVDVISDGIIVTNARGIIEDYNPAVYKFLNVEKNAYLGKPFDEAFPQYKNLRKGLDKLKENKLEISIEHRNRLKYYEVTSTPLFDHHQKFSGKLIIIHNITAAKRSEKALREANRQLQEGIASREKLIADLDAFAHTVAHDIMNTLGAIVTASDLTKAYLANKDYDSVSDLNNLVERSANKTLHITRELLTLASVRQQEVNRLPLDMAAIIDEAENRLHNMIAEKQAQILKPEKWPVAIGHAPWVEEVWVNYLSNGIKYGGTPPVLELGANPLKTGFIRFWIKDNGAGLSEEEQASLFNKYTRLAPKGAPGHGLGLSIVKRIMEKLDGKVGVTSPKGGGSVFYFDLPTGEAQPSPNN